MNITKANANRSSVEARRNGQKGGLASGKTRREKKERIKTFGEYAYMMLESHCDDINAARLKGLNIPANEQTMKLAMVVGLMNRVTEFGDVKAFEKVQELTNEQTNANLKLREQELALKQRELELKEKELELKLNQGVSDDKVVIVNDIEDIDESN